MKLQRNSNFIVNAVGIANSRQQRINIFIHIVAFYPNDETRDNDLINVILKFKEGFL